MAVLKETGRGPPTLQWATYHLWVWSGKGKQSGADIPWHWTSLEVLGPTSYLGRDFPEVKELGAIQG